jgi:hypothetical protein
MQKSAVTEARLRSYLERTGEALAKAKISPPERTFHRTMADDFYRMAKAYFDDAGHFFDAGDFVNAFACVNYAHGWLDAGARLGLFDVGEDDQLFTLSE